MPDVGVEPLRCGEQAKRPLGLAEGYGQVGDRLQRRGGPDPVAVVVQDLQGLVRQLPRSSRSFLLGQLREAEQRPAQREPKPWVGRQCAAGLQMCSRLVVTPLAVCEHAQQPLADGLVPAAAATTADPHDLRGRGPSGLNIAGCVGRQREPGTEEHVVFGPLQTRSSQDCLRPGQPVLRLTVMALQDVGRSEAGEPDHLPPGPSDLAGELPATPSVMTCPVEPPDHTGHSPRTAWAAGRWKATSAVSQTSIACSSRRDPASIVRVRSTVHPASGRT